MRRARLPISESRTHARPDRFSRISEWAPHTVADGRHGVAVSSGSKVRDRRSTFLRRCLRAMAFEAERLQHIAYQVAAGRLLYILFCDPCAKGILSADQ